MSNNEDPVETNFTETSFPSSSDPQATKIHVSERRAAGDDASYKRSIYALPVHLQVVVGTARPTIAELLQMSAGSIVPLNSKIDDPVDLCIDNRIIARGELIEIDAATGSIGVKLTEIVDVSEDALS